MLGLQPHEAVASDLGQDRGGGDRQTGRITAHDPPAAPAPDEVPRAVDEHGRRLEAETVDGPPGGQLLGG